MIGMSGMIYLLLLVESDPRCEFVKDSMSVIGINAETVEESFYSSMREILGDNVRDEEITDVSKTSLRPAYRFRRISVDGFRYREWIGRITVDFFNRSVVGISFYPTDAQSFFDQVIKVPYSDIARPVRGLSCGTWEFFWTKDLDENWVIKIMNKLNNKKLDNFIDNFS